MQKFLAKNPLRIRKLKKNKSLFLNFYSREGRSARHQLIFYSLLLETTKPYLVNTIRFPALHGMLLFARAIDTNCDCSRIVFDSWLQFKFADSPAAQMLLFQAVELREALNLCLEQKLEGGSYRSDKLAAKLVEFMRTELMCNLKSLMKADQKRLYTGPLKAELELPDSIRIRFERTLRYDDVKGGIALTDVKKRGWGGRISKSVIEFFLIS